MFILSMNNMIGQKILLTISILEMTYLERLVQQKMLINRMTFNSTVSWNFDNVYARNVITFNVYNTSSAHANNRKTNF